MLKNRTDSLAGKSLVLNILFLIINIVGLCFLVMGYHPSNEEYALLYKILGYSLLAISLVALYFLDGWILMAYFSRIIVGGVFIVSGLIKANDPHGFAYKLEEYFEDGALAYRIKGWFHWDSFSLEYFIQYALAIAVVICVIEIVLGAMILLGSRLRSSSWLIVFMLLFFTFLTWHTKECDPNATFADVDTYALNSPAANSKIQEAKSLPDKVTILSQNNTSITVKEIKPTQCVTDCGCFGDAMKGSLGRSMTPAESFWKDLILLYFALLLFIPRRKITLNSSKENIVMIGGGLIIVAYLSFIFAWTFPIYFTIIIMLLALWIKKTGGKFLGNEFGMILMLTFTTGLFITYVLMYSPVKDYRPYAVGKDLKAEMNNGKPGKYLNLMVYTNLHNHKDTTIQNLDESTKTIWGDTVTWKFKSRTTKVLVAPILPSIQQFNPSINIENITPQESLFEPISAILDSNRIAYINLVDTATNDHFAIPITEYNQDKSAYADYLPKDTIIKLNENLSDIDLKDYILEQPRILLIISRELEKGNFSRISRLKKIVQEAKFEKIPILMITSSSKEAVIAFRKQTKLFLPTLKNDNTELKAVTRSNPTLMLLKKGVVKGKYSARAIPSWEWLIQNELKLDDEK